MLSLLGLVFHSGCGDASGETTTGSSETGDGDPTGDGAPAFAADVAALVEAR